jgi:hypothetical protein
VEVAVNGVVEAVKYTAPYSFIWTPRTPGLYTIELRATDGWGNVGRRRVAVTAVRGNPWIFRAAPTRARAARVPARPGTTPRLRAGHAAPRP